MGKERQTRESFTHWGLKRESEAFLQIMGLTINDTIGKFSEGGLTND